MSNANRKRRKVNENSTKSEIIQPDTDISNEISCAANIEKRDSGKASPTNTSDISESKVKYVEAPIPKVNPWKKNEFQTDVNESNDYKYNTSGEHLYEPTDVPDKLLDSSASTKEILNVIHSSNTNQLDGNNVQFVSNSAAKNINTTEDNNLTKAKSVNPSPTMNASNQHRGEENSYAVPSQTATTAWKGTTDTISKLVPSTDEKVSSPRIWRI